MGSVAQALGTRVLVRGCRRYRKKWCDHDRDDYEAREIDADRAARARGLASSGGLWARTGPGASSAPRREASPPGGAVKIPGNYFAPRYAIARQPAINASELGDC